MSGFLRRRWVRYAALASAVMAVLAVAALAWALPAPLPKIPPEVMARTPDVEHGAYLAAVGDCTACHTRPGGAAFAGGLPFPLPIGVIYSSNITPDPRFGTGSYTLPEFIRLMRSGVARNGRRIYPAMPYTSYSKVSDTDLQDIWGWLQHGVTPVAEANRPNDIVWPLSIRWPVAFWNKLFLDGSRFQAAPDHDSAWNRGAYIVEGLGHCGTCHTPRGIAIQEKATANTSDLYLSGAVLDGAAAANLRGDPWTGLGRWTNDDIVQILKNGRNAHAVVAGPMTEVVRNSSQYMRDDDLAAIAVYLKSLGPAKGQTTGFSASDATYRRIMSGNETSEGAHMYMDSCSACHRLDGGGYDYAFPRLAGNATVLNASPDSLLTVLVAGARLPSTAGQPSQMAMPAFGWRYSDAQMAELATFVRSAWGNQAPEVTASQVQAIRKSTDDKARQR